MATATIRVQPRRRGRRFEETVRQLLVEGPRVSSAPRRDVRLGERVVRYVRSARQSLQ